MIIDYVYEPEVSEESDQNIHQEIQPNRRSGFFAILDEHRIGNLEPLELKTKKQLLRAELITYLDENATEEDPAHYWGRNQDRFPQLSKLYRKCASASATTSEVERMFSLAGNVLTDLRQ
uniref:HAT C-terminal dimerisation domain-containing protein n=1 Tax=Panagrolaimus sp. JU765 TaxID=591449 RepID=A0AC34QAK4_9BILA